MIALNEIIAYLEELAPKHLAEDYDNVGLMVGDKEALVSKVVISLDTDEKVADFAAKNGAQLVISHHPLLFKPAKSITKSDCLGRTIYNLIKNDISLYAMHTNFDSVSGGLGDYFFKTACDVEAYDSIEGEFPDGIGRIAELSKEITFGELIDRIKKGLLINSIRYVGDENMPVKTIAACNGGGADLIFGAYSMGADVYISGDLKYHHARYAYENGRFLIEVPHYEAEIIFCEYLSELLNKKFKEDCEFLVYKNENPWKIK